MAAWLGLKKPLFLAFFIGCTVSFLTAGVLTVRLIVPATIYWSFVPLIEIAALAAVCWNDPEKVPFSNLIDSFFAGYRPWLLWLAGMSAVWCFLSPSTRRLDWTVEVTWQFAGIAIAVVWSLYIDFCFFRLVLKQSSSRAARQLAIQRLISWVLILSVMGGPTIWSEITGRLW
ncbi:MAG TPA: hypothetical protein VGK48_22145 [Terriglobia bacterium]|jgi:hypothetical protein